MATRNGSIGPKHINYAIVRRLIHQAKFTEIVKELGDQDIADQNGFKVTNADYSWFIRKFRKVTDAVKDSVKAEYTKGILEEPLADVRYCLHKLNEIVQDEKTPIQVKVSAIKEARNIYGFEDADKRALKDSGSTINVSLAKEMQRFFTKPETKE